MEFDFLKPIRSAGGLNFGWEIGINNRHQIIVVIDMKRCSRKGLR